jgi:hypothetical protein
MNWDGAAALSAGEFADPKGYALDTPDEGIVGMEPRKMRRTNPVRSCNTAAPSHGVAISTWYNMRHACSNRVPAC